MQLHNLTPRKLRCRFGACPAVYRLDDGRLAIIGKRAEIDIDTQLKEKVGSDEELIVLSEDFFKNVTAYTSQK